MITVMNNMFYDPKKDFEDNLTNGPYFDEIPKLVREGEPQFSFLGFPLYLPFGIGAGPLPSSKHVEAAFKWGYDVVNYKTQRSVAFRANKFPHVVAVDTDGDISLEKVKEGLTKSDDDKPVDVSKLNITNLFGNPSKGPDYWKEDMARGVASAGKGQIMIGSAVGTIKDGFTPENYWQDFADTAKMVSDAGVKIVEVNLSCPNVASEGVICYTKDAVIEICRRSKEAIGDTPLVIKMGHYADEQQSLLEEIIAEVDQYIAAISGINTLSAELRDKQGKQALPGENRLKTGLCGAGIKWAGLEMVERLAGIRDQKGYNFEIIGMGGCMTPDDFFEYREAGADVVQACTAPMWSPTLAHEIASQMRKNG